MSFYGSWCLPTVSTATQNISSPSGGEKHQNTEEEEKNIPPVCTEDTKILVVVLTYSGSCLVSREKFCWSVMSGPGSSSILKLRVFLCWSRLRPSDLAEGNNRWSGGLRGPKGLWVLYEVWRPEPVEFLSSYWVSVLSAEVWEQHLFTHERKQYSSISNLPFKVFYVIKTHWHFVFHFSEAFPELMSSGIQGVSSLLTEERYTFSGNELHFLHNVKQKALLNVIRHVSSTSSFFKWRKSNESHYLVTVALT